MPEHRGGCWPDAPSNSGPLSGLRVLDFSRILAGPYATMQLADLGADIIKVEAPGRGDETRHWGPPFAEDGTASYFLSVNHGKRSIELDLADPDDAAIARALAVEADVVIDNFLPGRMERFGLDRATIAAENPRVVTATISGFGSGNAYSDRPGFDFLAQAFGGLMSITGDADAPPTKVGVAVTDLLSGSLCATGVLAALNATKQGQPGRHIEVSLLDAQVSMLANIASGFLVSGVNPPRSGNQHPSIAPYETLATADKPIAVAVGTDRQFQFLVDTLGIPQLGSDPRFATNGSRVANRPALVHELEAVLTTRASGEWLIALVAAGVPAAPVNSVAEALADPVIRGRMLAEVAGVPSVRTPIRVDGEPLEVRSPPPGFGAHTAEIKHHVGGHLRRREQGEP